MNINRCQDCQCAIKKENGYIACTKKLENPMIKTSYKLKNALNCACDKFEKKQNII